MNFTLGGSGTQVAPQTQHTSTLAAVAPLDGGATAASTGDEFPGLFAFSAIETLIKKALSEHADTEHVAINETIHVIVVVNAQGVEIAQAIESGFPAPFDRSNTRFIGEFAFGTETFIPRASGVVRVEVFQVLGVAKPDPDGEVI